MTDSKKIGVVYVGDFTKIVARFHEQHLDIPFERSIPVWLDPEVAALFEPSANWIIGVARDEQIHSADEHQRHVLVRRGVALGDVICVHGAIQGILRRYPERYRMSFQVAPGFVNIFKAHPHYVDVLGTDVPLHQIKGLDHVVSLDGLLEHDHDPHAEKINRVDRTWNLFFGARRDLMVNLKPDFRLNLPEEARGWAWRQLDAAGILKVPKIAVATRAVQRPRTIVEGLVEEFTRRLVDACPAEVVLIENDRSFVWQGKRIHSFPGSSVLQAMALMEQCDVLCTMDSGAMWMGHATAVPMVVWCGPTPPETKCNYHPFYPEGVRALKMWEWIGCPAACYEAATWCDFTYRCVKEPPREKFIADSITAVLQLLEWNRTPHGQEARRLATEPV